MIKEYRIIGRFAKDTKFHVVDIDMHWTKQDAERRLQEIKREEERSKQRGYQIMAVGMFSVSSDYQSDYELVELKIQEREITSWKDV